MAPQRPTILLPPLNRRANSVARSKKIRLDEALVSQGFFDTVDEALRAVMAGEVSCSNRRMESAGEKVDPAIELHVKGRLSYVSRGGLKLERGLDYFGVDPAGLVCLDVGCSTGGFTDCLLRRGAASVISVDVGYAQFSWKLRQDPRVRLLERTNIVDVPGIVGGGCVGLAVCDVSFTSVTTVLPAVLELLQPRGSFLTLVKPQFEAPREDVGEGGVVVRQDVRDAAVEKVRAAFEAAGLAVQGVCESPIHGAKGNIEYLLYGTR